MSKLEQDRQTGCYQVHFTGDEQQPTSRDLIISRGDKTYLISVTTPGFLEGLNEYNRPLDPSIQLDDGFYVMDDLPVVDELCQRLSQIPFEKLQPYLTEQQNS